MKMSRRGCCVVGCSNTYHMYQKARKAGKMISFYSFPNRPWLKERRQIWIHFTQRQPKFPEGAPWQPSTSSLICSEHFVGGEKSEDPRKENYNPTILDPKKSRTGKQQCSTSSSVKRPRFSTPNKSTSPTPHEDTSNEQAICTICSGESGFRSAKSYLLYPNFGKFCLQILKSTEDATIFLNTLKSFDGLSVCGSCLSLLSGAVNKDSELTKIEETIQSLQHQLVEQLKDLKRRVEDLYEGMRKIRHAINISDITQLKNVIALESKKDSQTRKQGELILKFREKVLTNVEKLQKFGASLEKRVDCSADQRLSIFSNLVETRWKKFKKEPEQENTFKRKSIDDCDDRPCRRDNSVTNQRAKRVDGVVSKRSKLDEKAKLIDPTEVQVVEIEDDILYLENDRDPLSQSHSIDSDSGNSQIGAIDSEDDDDKNRGQPISKSKSDKSKGGSGNDDCGVMSLFRKNIVRRLAQKNKSFQTKEQNRLKVAKESDKNAAEKSVGNSQENLLEKHPYYVYPLVYDSVTGSLNLSNIQVFIRDKEKCLQCSVCCFIARKPRESRLKNVESVIWNHVISRHTNVLHCKQCPSKLGSVRKFREHVRGHANQFKCDICGKPLFSGSALSCHKWTHMSQQEQTQAIEQGIPEPCTLKYKRLHKLDSAKRHVCSKCGKRFQNLHTMRQHEETHLKERERIMCYICGRTVLRKSFKGHQKVCMQASTSAAAWKCDICQKKFKNILSLRRHKNVHTSDKPFLCSQCPKTFRALQLLKRHQISHSEERPYVCRKGCGGGFKTGKCRLRHERLCNGQGTPVRKKAKQVAPPTVLELNPEQCQKARQ